MNLIKSIRSLFLVVCLVMILFGGWQPARAHEAVWAELDAKPDKLDPAVQASLKKLQPSDMVTVIVTLRQHADMNQVSGVNRRERQKNVILALRTTADFTQGRLKTFFITRRQRGLVQKFEPLWIINGFSVTATASVINELARHPDVYSISSDETNIVPLYSNPEANISLINAPALWALGYTGQGIVVASMDTGVDAAHADLSTRWRGGTNSWFDPYGQHATPYDGNGHGTQTMGIMVGGQAGGTTIGVAPDAKWIAVKIFKDNGTSTATAIHQGFQWLLDPDGNPNTADAPDVVNNSWGNSSPSLVCDTQYESDLQALRAAGILPIFAAGNAGPLASTSVYPANNPSAFAVGAIDNNSLIASFSSRGPTTCGGSTGPFPEVVAPGVNVNTSDLLLHGSYNLVSGTSIAAPHVAGALALLLSAYPNLTVAEQESALTNSAVDLGAPGPDDIYGYGRIDILAAYKEHIEAYIGGTPMGSYTVPPSQILKTTYPVDSGPMKVVSASTVPIIAALRDAWLVNGQITSFAQMMGLPKEQLSDTYWFPAYNNVTLSEQIRFANVDTVATDVTVTINGTPQNNGVAYHLDPNQGLRVTYAVDAGPVKVSSTGQKIIASMRDAWLVNGNITSFTEVMGLPKESLSDTFLFPAYNNVTLDGQLRFANVDTISTNVTVTIGGVDRGSYPLAAGASQRVAYALDAGPVQIKSDNGAKLIAALRDAWKVNGQIRSYAQLMGMPKEKLSDTYWFPAYNNMTLSGQLRFGNVDTVATDVTVTIAGVAQNGGVAYHLDPGTSLRVTYALDAGPVKIASTGQKIIAALRDAWSVNGAITSFVQMMGLPKEALSTTYWFPGYNNVTLSGQLRFAVP